MLVKNGKLFSEVVVPIYIPNNVVLEFPLSQNPPPNFAILVFKY